MAHGFDKDEFSSLARSGGLRYGQPLHYFEMTTSTNDEALAAERRGAPEGALFVAAQQSEGRGRRGRAWLSSAEGSLTFSLLVRPRVRQTEISAISLVVGLAVRDALVRHVDPQKTPLAIKWPNDVVCGRKKLAGILIEMSQAASPAAGDPGVVVGIGINTAARDFPAEIREIASSLVLLAGASPKPEPLLCDVLRALEARIDSFTTLGLGPCLAELERHDALRGNAVRIDGASGVARGISERGELLLERQGALLSVASGTVTYADEIH